jgi:hypothetical protein
MASMMMPPRKLAAETHHEHGLPLNQANIVDALPKRGGNRGIQREGDPRANDTAYGEDVTNISRREEARVSVGYV